MASHALTSAGVMIVAGLPREDKEKLLRELATECGYLLQPAAHTTREDFQRKLFVDEDE
jgi:hypothetical protein